MHYTELIDKLVRELSYRVGIPNVHDREHQSIMSEILTEWGEFDAKETIFNFLNEALMMTSTHLLDTDTLYVKVMKKKKMHRNTKKTMVEIMYL